jgi:protein-disulfide isomerase
MNRRSVVAASAGVLLLALGAGALVYKFQNTGGGQSGGQIQAALASTHSPALGNPAAKVHIVEFFDPACETCALFYPAVKQLMAANPDRVRLSVRHLAFHKGSDYVVRLLEASRKQDKYWQTLDAVLAAQTDWAPNHTVRPERVQLAIARVGLNLDQLNADMNSAEITQRIEQDRHDAQVLKVTQTPEYFVNGRPLPSFGLQQLQDLVRDTVQSAY